MIESLFQRKESVIVFGFSSTRSWATDPRVKYLQGETPKKRMLFLIQLEARISCLHHHFRSLVLSPNSSETTTATKTEQREEQRQATDIKFEDVETNSSLANFDVQLISVLLISSLGWHQVDKMDQLIRQ
jgi:hypothetical protein